MHICRYAILRELHFATVAVTALVELVVVYVMHVCMHETLLVSAHVKDAHRVVFLKSCMVKQDILNQRLTTLVDYTLVDIMRRKLSRSNLWSYISHIYIYAGATTPGT